MKKLMLVFLVACGVLTGCDYTVPLVKAPEIGIDAGVVGLWKRLKDDGQVESLLVLPLNKQEYMVSFPCDSKDAMFARACLCRCATGTIVQLEWFGTAQAKLPKDNRVFQFAAYSATEDTLRIRMLNADVVKRDVKSSDELARSIEKNKDNPELFKGEMVFKKIVERYRGVTSRGNSFSRHSGQIE